MNDPYRNTQTDSSVIIDGLKAFCHEAKTGKSDEAAFGESLQVFQALRDADGKTRQTVLSKLAADERKTVRHQETILKRQRDLSLLNAQRETGRLVKEEHPDHDFHCELVKAELALMRHFDFERIIVIGTETYPITAMLYGDLTGKPVICHERDARTSDLAKEAISFSNRQDRIEIINGDLDIAATRGGGLIVINRDVPLKRSLLKNIRKNGDEACYILCRTKEVFEPSLHKALWTKSLPGFFPVRSLRVEKPEQLDVFLLSSRKEVTARLEYRWLDRLNIEDKEKILKAMNTIIVKDPGIGYPFPLSKEEGDTFADALDCNIRTGTKHMLLVEYQNELAAQAILTPNASLNNKHLAEISRAFVMEPFRGIGLELLALKKIVARAKGLGIKTLVLDARGGTNAPKRWKTIGFQVYGVLPNYSCVRGRYYDGIYMYQTVEDFEARFGPCNE